MKLKEGASEIDLPGNTHEVVRVCWVQHPNFDILIHLMIDVDFFALKNKVPLARGVPTYACEHVGQLLLYPACDKEYEVIVQYTTLHQI